MKFTEIQRKLHQLLNEYEAAVKELAKLLKSDSAIPAGVLRELAGLIKNSERIL